MFLLDRIGLVGTLLVAVAVITLEAGFRRLVIEMATRAKLVNDVGVVRGALRQWIMSDWSRLDYVTGNDAPVWLRCLTKHVLGLEQQWGRILPVQVGETRTWFEHDRPRNRWYHCRQFIPRPFPALDIRKALTEDMLASMALPEDPAFFRTVRTAAEAREMDKLSKRWLEEVSGRMLLTLPFVAAEQRIRGLTIDELHIDDAQAFGPELEKETLVTFQLPGAEPNMNGDSIDPEALRDALQEFVGKANDAESRAAITERLRQRYEANEPIDFTRADWVEENNYRVSMDCAKDVAKNYDEAFLAAVDAIVNTPPPDVIYEVGDRNLSWVKEVPHHEI